MVRPALPLLGLVLSACGGTSGSPPPRPDADPVDTADAMPQRVCTLIESAYGDLGELTGTALFKPVFDDEPDGAKYLELQMPLNTESPPDLLFVELYDGVIPFEGGFAPVTTTLTGDQSDLFLCGACAFITADDDGGAIKDFNMSYNGTLVVESIDPTPGSGQVKGSLSDIKFHDVDIIEGVGQETVADGCLSTLEKVSFDFGVALP